MKYFRVRYEGQWGSGWHCWTDRITGSSFSTKTKRAKEVLEAVRAVRNNFDERSATCSESIASRSAMSSSPLTQL